MARYLVGEGSNTWDFDQAYKAAQAGDIIELEKNYTHYLGEDQRYIIDKNITICGWKEINENGGAILFSEFQGGFIVRGGAELTLENICVYSNGDTATIVVEENSKVNINVSIVGNKFPGNSKVLMWNKGGELNIERVTLTSVDEKINNIKLQDSSKTKFRETTIETIIVNDSELEFLDGSIINHNGNGINSKSSKVFIDNTYIEGSDTNKKDRYPIIWGAKSEITIKNSTIKQPKYTAAIYTTDNSELYLENVDTYSLKISKTRAKLNRVSISSMLYAMENSLIIAKDRIDFKGEWSEKIDIYACGDSAIVVDLAYFNRVINPNVRLEDNTHLRIKELVFEEGNVEDLVFDVDDTSSLVKPEKSVEKVIERTDIEVEKISARQKLDNLVGLKKVKAEIEKMLRMVDFNKKRIEQGLSPEKQVFHSVFVGNPGTGKTTVARLIGEILYEKGAFTGDKFIYVEAKESDIISANVGQTAIQMKNLLEKARGGVLFIDEAYTLDKGNRSVNFGIEAINTILAFMEDHRDEIMIIFAGYTKEMDQFLKTNPGLKSRVPNTFDFEDYSPEEIVEIGTKYLGKEYALEDKEYYSRVIQREYKASLDKSNARWIRNINESLVRTFASRVMESGDEDIVTIKNIDIDEVFNAGKFENDGTKRDAMEELNKLIGISKVKEQVNNFVALAEMNKKRAEQGKGTSAFSLHSMFLGNPGTGKTTVARIVGEILYQKGVISKNKLIEVSRTDLVAGYIGQTADKTRKVLESALGGVLFIDEAYALNGNSANDFGQEAIDEILKFMEDYRSDIVIIFAGYTKEMSAFLEMNSGLRSRIPNTFDFEDYSADEIVKIGLLGIDKSGYKLNRELYADTIKLLYQYNDGSNGRWIRNINEKLITNMSTRVSREGSDDFDEIIDEDIEKLKENIYDK